MPSSLTGLPTSFTVSIALDLPDEPAAIGEMRHRSPKALDAPSIVDLGHRFNVFRPLLVLFSFADSAEYDRVRANAVAHS